MSAVVYWIGCGITCLFFGPELTGTETAPPGRAATAVALSLIWPLLLAAVLLRWTWHALRREGTHR